MTECEIIQKVILTLESDPNRAVRYSSELDNFKARLFQSQNNKYRLGVIGVTSSGKSTMINSLLGESLLPAVARPSSSQLVSCFHGEKRYADIFFENNTKKRITGIELSPKIIEKYGDEGFNKNNKENVKQIEISSPKFPFSDSIILIDSPGLDAYGYAGHEQLTMNSLLPTIDFCIFVTTCKTNSDDKMLSVLNTVAEYDKPIIIVQNMIDSLRPSIDGIKSVADVAQEHKYRVERIINASKITDKSSVHVVQISAINALKSRVKSKLNVEDNKLFNESNFKLLISVVNNTFNLIRPRVEGARLSLLKKEIQRISSDAIKDGKRVDGTSFDFQYKDIDKEYKTTQNQCISSIKQSMNSLSNLLCRVNNQYTFDEKDINYIVNLTNNVEHVICNQMKSINHSITLICSKLNIDSRNIHSDFRFEKPTLRIKEKTEVDPYGQFIEGKKLWYTLWLKKGKGHWEPTIKTVVDVRGSIENAKNYLQRSMTIYQKTIENWKRSIEITENKLYHEIENRKNEFIHRKEQALDCQRYLKIGEQLRTIANYIPEIRKQSSSLKSEKTDVINSLKHQIKVPETIYSIYKIAEKIRINIHTASIKAIISPIDNIIIGWDEQCEKKLASYFFGIASSNINNLSFGRNQNRNRNIDIWHKPSRILFKDSNSSNNIFVLVNATQFGSALKEIAQLNINDKLSFRNKLYFVIQDFQEIVNGESIIETMDNMKQIKKELALTMQYTILLLHDNPLFNLAAIEAQVSGCNTQQDEIRIIHDLQQNFSVLFPAESKEKIHTENIVKIIIQKLGKK